MVLGSDDGLCGAYNVNIFKQLVARMSELRESLGNDVAIELYPVGKKMLKAVARLAGQGVTVCVRDGLDSKTTGDGVREFVDALRADFEAGNTDRVDYLYMNFKSVSRQRPEFGQLLPVTPEAFHAEGVKRSAAPIFSSLTPRQYSTRHFRCFSWL